MKRRASMIVSCVLSLLLATASLAQDVRHEIQFPDVAGYETLKCDLHMHTVFSDGSVWPQTRVNEAWRQGLDVISITDHIEYQPHKADLPTNHARPYELASGTARQKNIVLIRGAEITRDTPPGHFNAIFLNDIKPVETPEFVDAIKNAAQQEAFIFWNHQGWKGEEAGRWLDVHTQLHENKWIHGMEVANGDGYHPTAHKWCMEKGFTMLGNSDIHDPDLVRRNTAGEHRTLTLVFAKDRSLPAIKESLAAGRTAVWFADQVIGRKEWLEPLFAASVRVAPPHLRGKSDLWVEIHNGCDADVKLERTGKIGPAQLTLPARTTSLVRITTSKPNDPVALEYTATNFLIEPGKGLPVTLAIPGAK